MKCAKLIQIAAMLAVTAMLGSVGTATAQTAAAPAVLAQAAPITEQEAHAIAVDAYVYLYSIMSMDVSRKQFTNGTTDFKGPMNTFVNVPEYPPASFKAVVRTNFDTLYSASWLDMTKEPVVISAPDTDGRYYLLPMLDMWTDVFASPGWRTTGTKAGTFLVTPPGWRPDLRDRFAEEFNFRRIPSASKPQRLMSGSSAAPRRTARRTTMRFTRFRLAIKSRCFPNSERHPSRLNSSRTQASI
jgi:hypothetical protein